MNLYSHADQQQQMQTAALNVFGEVGWGGDCRQDPVNLRGKFPDRDFARRQQRVRGGTGGPADRMERRPNRTAFGLLRFR